MEVMDNKIKNEYILFCSSFRRFKCLHYWSTYTWIAWVLCFICNWGSISCNRLFYYMFMHDNDILWINLLQWWSMDLISFGMSWKNIFHSKVTKNYIMTKNCKQREERSKMRNMYVISNYSWKGGWKSIYFLLHSF